MDTRIKEALRYLGYGSHAADGQTLALVEDSFGELERLADRRIICRIFPVTRKGAEELTVGSMEIASRNLSRNLRDCGEAVLFAATLGAGVDHLLRRYAITDLQKAVVLFASAVAMLEEYLDEWQQQLGAELEREGKYLRPRFSPGYGDFDIKHQEMLLRMLNADKSIGLAMTDSYMLAPSKSVTGVIGISGKKERCPLRGCEACGKKDCIYRRDT